MNKFDTMEEYFIDKERKRIQKQKEQKRDKIIALTILIISISYLIGNILEWYLR